MKLAVFTPLPPARSGIADYSYSLLPHIAAHCELEVFVDQADWISPAAEIPVRSCREYRPEDFDETLYQLGNNPFHVFVYDALFRHPGTLLMHELNLHHLMADATIKRGDWARYLREVEIEGEAEDIAYAQRAHALEVGPDYEGLTMNRSILEAGKAAIVHSRFMADKLHKIAPSLAVRQIPHGAWIPETNRNRYRAKLGIDEATPLIGVFGFLKPYKRIAESLRAMRRLVRLDPRVRMILAGEEHPDFPVRRMVEDLGLSENVRLLGYVSAEEFPQWISACDVCLNLRYPTAGETSGTLLRALGLGRATVVSDLGSFADLPDEICLKIPVDPGEVDLIFEYLNLLITRPEIRRALGARARDYVARECSWPHVGRMFAEFLEASAAGRAASVCEPTSFVVPNEVDAVDAAKLSEPEAHAPEPTPLAAEHSEVEPDEQAQPPEESPLAAYIRGFGHDKPEGAAYIETHLTRLLRTFELTPPGGPEDAVLEMGAYMHLTPALKTKLGYGEVRGCYLGPVGKVDRRCVRSAEGEVFECEVDHFNAEKDRYPYSDERFKAVLCCELIEHLYDDPMHLMAEVNRILRPDGRLIVTTPNICSARAVGAVLLNYHPGLFHQYVVPSEDGTIDPRHAREYSPRDIHGLFEAAGFDVETLDTGPYREESTREYDWVQQLLQRYELSLDQRGDVIFAVGRKTGPVRERYPAAVYAGGAH